MNRHLFVVFTFLALTLSSTAYGIIELRLNYGISSSQMKTDSITALSGAPNLPGPYGLGIDAIISLPLIPIGFGLRMENLATSVSAAGVSLDEKLSRTAAIINYRFIDTIIHIGLIATVGISHKGEVTLSGNKYESSGGIAGTYSLGAEACFTLIGFLVGAEAGYQKVNLGNMKTSSGTAIGQDIDHTGPYVKILAGLSF